MRRAGHARRATSISVPGAPVPTRPATRRATQATILRRLMQRQGLAAPRGACCQLLPRHLWRDRPRRLTRGPKLRRPACSHIRSYLRKQLRAPLKQARRRCQRRGSMVLPLLLLLLLLLLPLLLLLLLLPPPLPLPLPLPRPRPRPSSSPPKLRRTSGRRERGSRKSSSPSRSICQMTIVMSSSNGGGSQIRHKRSRTTRWRTSTRLLSRMASGSRSSILSSRTRVRSRRS